MSESEKKSRIPPNSKESEMMVLGCMLTSINALNVAADTLEEMDFYYLEHQTVFTTLKTVYRADKPADIHIISEELKKIGKLDAIGGVSYLTTLAQYAGTSAYIEEYIDLVKEKAILRRMIHAAQGIEKTSLEGPADVHAALDQAQAEFYKISQSSQNSLGVSIKDLITGVKAESKMPFLKELQARQQSFLERGPGDPGITGVPTHFTELDKMLNGFMNSNLILLGARPAMGKCVTGDTPILDPKTGRLTPIKELVEKKSGHVVTLNSNGKLDKVAPAGYVADGIKPTFKLTTALGKEIEATAVHPLLTMEGWKKLEELRVGDRIAIPRELPYFGSKNWTNSLEETVYKQSFPDAVFELTRENLAKFLNRLCTAQIPIHASVSFPPAEENFLPLIVYSSTSKKIISQVQHLLLRFGILSKIASQENASSCFELEIQQTDDLIRFCQEIGARGEEETINDLLQKTQPSQPIDSTIYWDSIRSIEATGEKEVFDLCVSGTHNFVAADIIVHNTALILSLAENICFRNKVPVGIFSLEMSSSQLLGRLICSQSEVESQKIQTGSLNGGEYQRIVGAVNNMQKHTMIVDDQPGLKITDLRARARRMKEAYNIGFLAIDYLQLLSGSGNNRSQENRQSEISEISRMLKTLARELNIPILCAAQLSRKVEERQGHRPMMSDLRESGSLEQDSDVIMFLFRRDYYDKHDKPGMAELLVAKNRHGGVGDVPLTFRKEVGQFANYTPINPQGDMKSNKDAFAAFSPE